MADPFLSNQSDSKESRSHSSRSLRCALLLVCSLVLANNARADAEDTFSLVAGVNFMHDDNLFRLSSSTDPQTVLGKSTKADDITVSSLTLKVNKPYSLQRFELEASLIDYRYRTFDYLSYTTEPYSAAWRWSVTPNLHGNLTTSHTQSSSNFSDYTGYTTRNTNTSDTSGLDGVFDLSASWHLLGGVSNNTTKSSQTITGEADNRVTSTHAGVSYTFPSGSELGYLSRNGRGEYINHTSGFAGSRFENRDDEVHMRWALTGKTQIDARLAHTQREEINNPARDFGGTVGNVNINWAITGKTSLNAGYSRELSSYQTNMYNYTTSDHFTLMPVWQIGAKTSLRGKYDYVRRFYPVAFNVASARDRDDAVRTMMIALDWHPLRSLTVSSSLQNEKRSSNLPGLDYTSTSFGINAQLTF